MKKNKKKRLQKGQNKKVGRKVAVTVSGEAEKVTGPVVAHGPGPCGGALSIVRPRATIIAQTVSLRQ